MGVQHTIVSQESLLFKFFSRIEDIQDFSWLEKSFIFSKTLVQKYIIDII